MKRLLIGALMAMVTLSCLTQCQKNDNERFELVQVAKIISVDEMRSLPVGITQPIPATKTGKIYIYNDFLFISEAQKGIHIYNNANPAAPVNVGFLQVPGNVDLAITNNVLYADSYVDLLAFDIANMTNIKLVKRVNDVFQQFYLTNNTGQKQIVTYKDTLVSRKDNGDKNIMYADAASNSGSGGQGGSMARFTLLNKHLYTVGQNNLSLFDVNVPSNPTFVKAIGLAWGVETIFPYENKLFIGTNNGMHIFNATDPGNPVKLSTYAHVFACDPVAVQGKYAFVTLRTGNSCRQATNQLEVVDIENPSTPKLVAVFPMQNPHGLSVTPTNLYLCEGNFGLKSFNIADVNHIDKNLLQHLQGIKSFDVIAGPKSLIVTGEDGVYQFNNKQAGNLAQLSKIKVKRSLISSMLK